MIEKFGITPGPWIADCRTGSFIVDNKEHNCFSGISDDVIVYQSGRGEESSSGVYKMLTDTQVKNARLIAAAPEMLEALIEGVVRNERNGEPCEQMYLAIEKATGRTWEEVKTIIRSEK